MLRPTFVSILLATMLAMVAPERGGDAVAVSEFDCVDPQVARAFADLRVADLSGTYRVAGFVAVRGHFVFRYRPVSSEPTVDITGALAVVDVNPACATRLIVTGDPDAAQTFAFGDPPAASAAIAGPSLRTASAPAVYHSTVLNAAGDTPRLVDRYLRDSGASVVVDRATGLALSSVDGSRHGLTRVESPTTEYDWHTAPTLDDDSYVTMTGAAFLRDPGAGGPVLQPVYRLHGQGDRLDGKYASVTSATLDHGGLPTPQSSPGEFVYEPMVNTAGHCDLNPPTCSRLDNVNAYVHIDRFAHEFWLGQQGIEPTFQATVVTHQTNAVSRVRGDTISVGWGGMFLNNNALEDEILYHEYTHAILTYLGFAPDIFSTIQRRALGEGYADYFALTFADQPELGDWATRCPPRHECEGPEDATEIRTLDTDPSVWNWNYGLPSSRLKYGVCTRKHLEDGKCKTSWMTFDNTYVWGMIWGSTLWDVRKALGAATADELVAMSLVFTGGEVFTATTASGAIIFADRELNGGANEPQLREIFQRRGIAPHVSVWTSTEGPSDPTEFALQVSPNPFTTAIRIQANLDKSGSVSASLYDMSGRLLREFDLGVRPAGHLDQTLDVPELASGRYLLRLRAAGRANSGAGQTDGPSSATRLVIRAR